MKNESNPQSESPSESSPSSQPEAPRRRWGLIGAGKMATALARGMIDSGAATPDSVIAYDPHPEALAAFARRTGAATASSNRETVERSDALIIAVKPGAVPAALAEIREAMTDSHLTISVAAGVTLKTLESALGDGRRVIRTMPNTPALVGAGASAYAMGRFARPEDETIARSCLDAVGRAWKVPEALLDAVTGLSGSGPAFVFVMIEALADGGVRMGLPRDVALALAGQTLFGAAKLMLETGEHPGALKDQVASPGGTTIAGLHALERGGVRAALIDAVQAATLRSAELAATAAQAGKG